MMRTKNAYFFVEAPVSEFSAAFGTDEVFGVEGLSQCRYAALKSVFSNIYSKTHILNGTITVRTSRRKQIMVVVFAVRFSGPFEEVLVPDLIAAMATYVMFWVPHFAERNNDLKDVVYISLIYPSDNGLPTRNAIPFRDGVNAVLVHVDLQIPQHRIQLRRVFARIFLRRKN